MKDKQLKDEIVKRYTKEQTLRKASVAGTATRFQYKKIDRQNVAWMKKIFSKQGLPSRSVIGKKASEALFMMVRHADHDRAFQQHVLRLLKKNLKKEPKEYPRAEEAYLTDRLLANAGKPILYGTLYDVDGINVRPKKIRDEKDVNKRRKETGIPTTVEGRRRALVRELKRLKGK